MSPARGTGFAIMALLGFCVTSKISVDCYESCSHPCSHPCCIKHHSYLTSVFNIELLLINIPRMVNTQVFWTHVYAVFVSEIFDDIREECSKYGRIRSMQIPRPNKEFQVPGVGKVILSAKVRLISLWTNDLKQNDQKKYEILHKCVKRRNKLFRIGQCRMLTC